jgi:putative iron-dependent peroxidase
VPSATFLENVGDDAPPARLEPSGTPDLAPPQPAPKRDGSLGIGSLKGDLGS